MLTDDFLLRNESTEIDLQMIYNICGDDSDSIKRLVQTFLKNIPETVQKLENYLLLGDEENIYKTAHAARSSLSIIQVKSLFDIILQIEKKALAGNYIDVLGKLIAEAVGKYADVQKLLHEKFT